MNKIIFNLINALVLVSVLVFSANNAYSDSLPELKALPIANPASIKPVLIPQAPKLNAKAYILIDVNSGKILAESNADQRRPPASLTKMMTLYVVSQAISNGRITLDDKVRISRKAWRTGGSRMFVREGQSVPVRDLIQGVIVDSGNDACVALAEHVAGSEPAFADLMNQTAKSLGMTESHFVDSTGMPNPQHYTSARDLAILARALVQNFPKDYAWYKQKWFKFNGIRQPNRNRLLWRDQSVDGIKTGHTQAAGYCLVASAKRNGMRLLSVVMGTPTDEARAAESQRLLNYGFRFYQTYTLYNAGQTLSNARIWKGVNKTIPVGVAQNMELTIPKQEYQQLKAKLEIENQIQAPIKKGQALGKVLVNLNGKTIAEQPLIALTANERAGIYRRTVDAVSLAFSRWFGNNS